MTAATGPGIDSDATAARQVPPRRRFLWGLGGMTDCLTYNGMNCMADQVYVIGLGMRPEAIGLARGLPRLLDVVTDPIIGHLSDNTRSRWGRRRPWMLCGALLSAVIVVLMWYPPTRMGPLPANAYVVAMFVLLYTLGYSLFTIPYTAQGYELSTDYNERTHVFQWRLYAFAVTGFLTPWFPWLCMALEGTRAEILRGTAGVHWVSLAVAALILLTATGPVFGCREGGQYQRQRKVRFLDAVKFTARNRAFWPLVASNFLSKFGMCVTGIFFYYVMLYHISGGRLDAGSQRYGIFCNVINVATFLAMAPLVRLTDKLGKRPVLLLLTAASAAAYGSVWFTLRPQTAGWVLTVADVLHHVLKVPAFIAESWPSLVTAASIGAFCNVMPLIINSMLADVCDVDELHCGHRREAFYGAVFVTCDKIAMAVTLLLQGFLLNVSGFDSRLAVQAPETIAFWMLALLLTQPVGFLLGFGCIMFYPISRANALEVRRQLNERAETAAPASSPENESSEGEP